VREALEITAELGFTQLGIGFEDRGRSESGVDQLGRLVRSGEGTVHDPLEAGCPQPIAYGERLRAPEGAELEAVQMPIQQPARVFDVGVADQIDASGAQNRM